MKPLCCLVFAVVVPAGPVAAQDKVGATPYYPLQVDTTWTYRLGLDHMIVKVVRHERVGTVMCARVETTMDGKPLAFEHLSADDKGVYRHTFNGNKLDKPILLLKLPPKKGETWDIDAKSADAAIKGHCIAGMEAELTVPAGSFKDVATVACDDLDANGLKIAFTAWYAKGPGPIKLKIQVAGKDAPVYELEKFEAGKK